MTVENIEKVQEQVKEWDGVRTTEPCVVKGCTLGEWKDLGNGKREQRCEICNRLISTATMPEEKSTNAP